MRRFRLLAVAGILLVSTVFVLIPGHSQLPITCSPLAAEQGCWLPPFSENGDFNEAAPDTEEEAARYPTAVSMAVLPDGNIVYWNGLEGTENLNGPLSLSLHPQESRSRVLDLSSYLSTGADPRESAEWSIPTPEDGGGGDLFCADQRLLADGRVLAVGGTEWRTVVPSPLPPPEGLIELFGRKNARLYDADANSWTQAASMNFGRWYPTLLTLPDGKQFVASGVGRLVENFPGAPGEPTGTGDNVNETEIYDPATNTWTVNPDQTPTPLIGPGVDSGGNQSLPLFARLHLLPNGKVFYDATGQMWGPAGESVYQGTWNFQKFYDPATNSWQNIADPPAALGARSGVASVFLPLKPPYDRAELLLFGGTLSPTGPPGTLLATAVTEKAVWTAGDPNTVKRSLADDMNIMRWYSSGVALPSGEVLAFSGADKDEVIEPGIENAIRQAELWDPEAEAWRLLSSGARDRTYHNSAVLLPDGSVLVGGHSPIVHSYGQNHQTTNANNFKDPSFEIFKPPYLFRGERPSITHAVPSKLKAGGVYPLGVKGDARNPTLKVVLSKLPSTTHITDADQRTVEVAIVHRSGNTLIQFQMPANSSVVPPGYYYLWVMKDNGEGPTPSHAQIVQVS